MLRRILIALFILANLTSQVSVAYACAMMGGTVVKQCCCPHHTASPESRQTGKADPCCKKVVEISPGVSHDAGDLATAPKVPDHSPQLLLPVLLPALLAIVLPAQSPGLAFDDLSEHGFYGTDLYLRTQRLRL